MMILSGCKVVRWCQQVIVNDAFSKNTTNLFVYYILFIYSSEGNKNKIVTTNVGCTPMNYVKTNGTMHPFGI